MRVRRKKERDRNEREREKGIAKKRKTPLLVDGDKIRCQGSQMFVRVLTTTKQIEMDTRRRWVDVLSEMILRSMNIC